MPLMKMRSSSALSRCLAFYFGLCLSSAAGVSVSSQAPAFDESQIRAMIVVNLTRFVDWPPERNDVHSPFIVCAVGREPVGANLESALTGKTVRGRSVIVRRGVLPEEAAPCHILYDAHPRQRQSNDLTATLAKASVLTISEDSPGTVMGLPLVDGRVQIEINRSLAQRSNLTLSSQLFQIAMEGR